MIASTHVLRAMGDPVRWQILVRISQEPELARSVLERVLPLGKGVLSRQTRILAEAGLIDVRRRGRQVFYALRRDTVDQLSCLVEGLVDGTTGAAPMVDAAPSPRPGTGLADVLVLPLGRRRVQQT
ncbi:helix-turn-helix transcriptional regulator [Blastococcus sp. URHD0036]|uniref:ArsR/SmtB family transcription factor n=1 Tax=Blastococcus sp. URHD0036 TaxID=1380356 RepID=UPI000550FAA8|nr:helix-turn-helix domain-containing protein [Blastococcus sp. URHD0036]